MRPALVFLFLLAMFSVYAAQAADDTGCPACAELAGRPRAQMTAMVDSGAKMLEITAYYENLTASPARQPLNNSVLILQVSPVKSEAQLLRIYTDATGKAKYNFQQFTTGGYADQCVQFKIVYCPFCIPETTECGFEACMNFSRITTAAKKVSEIKNAPDAVPPAALNGEKFLPSAASAAYCPPPPTGAETPALCLPLIIVFSLLSGALYATGRNPFAGFDFSGARMGGIPARYQPRGRGVAVSSMAVASAASSIGGAAKTKKDAEAKAKAEGKSAAEAKKAGWAALAGQEKAMAKGRVFLLGGMSRAKETVKALRSSKTAAAEAVKRAETKKGAPLSGMERRAVVGKAMAGHIDARLAGMGGLGGGGAKETATGKGSIFAPITGAVIRGSEIAHVSTSKSFMGQWMGTMFGTLGKAALVMTLNSQPVQLIDAFRYAFTPTGSHKSLYELVGLVNNEKRAIADLESLSLMKKDGGATILLPNGKTATAVGMETLKDAQGKNAGAKIFLLVDKEKPPTGDNVLVLTVDKKGRLESLSCTRADGSVLALMANPEKGGSPILVVNPEKTVIKGNAVFVEPNPDAKQIGVQPGADAPQAEKLAHAKAAEPIYAALAAAGGGSILFSLGGKGEKLVSQCSNNLAALEAINSSYQTSLGAAARDLEKEIYKQYTPEQRKEMLDTHHDKVASEAMMLALGRVAPADEFKDLKASPLSNTSALGSSIAGAAGFDKEHGYTQRQASAAGSAIAGVLEGKSTAEISALAQNPEQFRSAIVSALVAQGIPQKEAEGRLTSGVVNSISAGIDDAVHRHNAAPVVAVADAITRSDLSTILLGDKKAAKELKLAPGTPEGFSTQQAAAAASGIGNYYMNGSTLAELESAGKETAKIKAAMAQGLQNHVTSLFMDAGVPRADAEAAARLTLSQVTGLELKKDPLAGGKVPLAVSEAISTISMQLVSTGMNKVEARREAEAIIHGMSDPALGKIAASISDAARDMSAQLGKAGFSQSQVADLKSIDVSQLYSVGGAKGTVVPPSEAEKTHQFVDLLARDMNGPAVSEGAKPLLQKFEANLAAQAQSQQLAAKFSEAKNLGEINFPGLSDRIATMGAEYANSFNPQISQLLKKDPVFMEHDKPAFDQAGKPVPGTGPTIAENFAAGTASQAESSRLERKMYEAVEPTIASLSKGQAHFDLNSAPEEKTKAFASVEDYRRNELADALATGDLASAQATCASQVKFYRNLGDENAAAAWNDAFASVIDLKRSGAPSSGMDKVAEGVMEKLYLSAGTPEHIASSSVDYAEAQKATASHYMNNAMQRVEEVLSKIPPPETPKKRSGEEPPKSPPEVPPSNAPAPSLARKATPAGKKG